MTEVGEPQPRYSRRSLLIAGGISVGMVGASLLGLAAADTLPPTAAEEAKQRAIEQAIRKVEEETTNFNEEFKLGILSQWTKVNVWPGLLAVPHSVQLFGNAELSSGSEIQWPSDQMDNHLLVQRPYFADRTAKRNVSSFIPAIGLEVMAFCMPNSNDLAFFDQAAYMSEVVPASNYPGGVYSRDKQDPPGLYLQPFGEDITLQNPLPANGLSYRYLTVSEQSFDNEGNLVNLPVDKVCGRSEWGGTVATAFAVNDFDTGQGDDVVTIPRRNG